MYEACFNGLTWEAQQRLVRTHTPVSGFFGETVKPLGKITFPVTVGDNYRERTIQITFLVIPAPLKHNIILGRTAIGALRAIISTPQNLMMFRTPKGVVYVPADIFCLATDQVNLPPLPQ